jgi:hypothetical protein
MSLPPNATPPPPPPAYPPPPPPMSAAPGYAPAPMTPTGYAPAPPPPGRVSGKASPARLVAVFVIVLVVVLAIGAALVLAVAPGPTKPDCPDPSKPCAAPPVVPTLPPVAGATPGPVASPAATIVRPSGSLSIPSSNPSPLPSIAPAATKPGASATIEPSAPATVTPSVAPTAIAADLPQPRGPSNAGPLAVGQTWTSRTLGFQLEYDPDLWSVEEETDTGIVLSAGNGAVLIAINGFPAATSPTQLVQSQIKALSDLVLGLTEETDPSRQLPGQPVVGHRQGTGVLLNGTLNSPQGPTDNADVVIIAAADPQVAIRFTVIAVDDVRDPAFSVADTVNNSIVWPTELP